MFPYPRLLKRLAATSFALLVVAGLIGLVRAADHNDGNGVFAGWDLQGRRDANITDFFAFRSPSSPFDTLVLVLLVNQGISDPGYFFAEDLTLRFHIDNHSQVTFSDDNPQSTTDDWMMRFGGTVTEVDKINDDIVFEVTFEPTRDGKTDPKLAVEGLPAWVERDIVMFPAPGESPVRRLGRAALVLEVPLALVVGPDRPGKPPAETLLLWATSKVPEVNGPRSDHMGMPNTSNQLGNIFVNRLRPRDQAPYISVAPPDLFLSPLPGNPVTLAPYADVLIYELAKEANAFPPGRGNPNMPPPPGFVQFDPFNPSRFPNGRPMGADLSASPFTFPYIAP